MGVAKDFSNGYLKGLGVTAEEIDIKPSCLQMLKDIGHPYAAGKAVYDITFENVQAGERTSHLFRLANQHNAPVIGTGDLSDHYTHVGRHGVAQRQCGRSGLSLRAGASAKPDGLGRVRRRDVLPA